MATPSVFENHVERRFGVLPSFFRSAPAAPEVMENLWGFAQAAYLDNPLPSLFKERLFVYLSRFCEARYCVVRHLGFLVGRGRPAGDDAAQAITIEQAVELLKRPAPSQEQVSAAILRLESIKTPIADWPDSGSELDDAIVACAAVAFLEPARSGPARRALTVALGSRRFEQLIAYLAFVRTAHFWTLTHPDLELEPDLDALLRDHKELARLLFEDPEAGRSDMGRRLWDELQTLRGEKKARDLLEALPTPTYTTDAAGRLTYYNKAAAELWGYRPELGKAKWCGSWRLYWPDGAPLPHDECPMALVLRDNREIQSVQGVAERPDGSRVPFVAQPRAIRDESGAVVGGVNTLVDVSELKNAERRLRESEQYARKLLDALPAAVYTTDAAGRITYFNQAAVDLAGRRPELGSDEWCVTWRLYHPDGRPLPHEECPMAVALKEDRPIRVEAVAERPDGARVPFIPYPTPLHDGSGALVGAVNMLVDISERKRAEEAAQLLAAIVENSNDAIVSTDLDGVVTSWNSGAERLFGYTADEALGKPFTPLMPPDRLDEELEILRRIRRGEQVDPFETVRMRKDGSLLDLSLTISPVKDANGDIIGASKVARDISERKQAQARQELLTREIQHRTKNLFAVVQAVVGRSFAGKRTVEDAESAVLSRLSSLAQTHVMLMDMQWEGADLRELVEAEMSPYAAARVRIDGPKVTLNAKAAQNFGLAIHELATNAAKYGALSNSTGQIEIGWSVGGSNDSRAFVFRWRELGGPPVEAPERKGFGSIVLERIMGECFAEPPRIDFAPSGVRYELHTSLEAITGADQDALRGHDPRGPERVDTRPHP